MPVPSELVDAEHALEVRPALVDAWSAAPFGSKPDYGDGARYAPLPADPYDAAEVLRRDAYYRGDGRYPGAQVVNLIDPVPDQWRLAPLEPPQTGWGSLSANDTLQIARNALTARRRASVARRTASDESASADARRKAARTADELDKYVEYANEVVRVSSRAWLPAAAVTFPTAQPQRIGNW